MNTPATSPTFNFADIEHRVEENAARRAQRRKELREKNIAADERIVAWIDILGFSHDIQEARTETQFRTVYHKMLFVHEMFDSPSASDEPEERERINKEYGRTVLALSDGLVVTASAKAEARAVTWVFSLIPGTMVLTARLTTKRIVTARRILPTSETGFYRNRTASGQHERWSDTKKSSSKLITLLHPKE